MLKFGYGRGGALTAHCLWVRLPWRLFWKYHLHCKEKILSSLEVRALSCKEEKKERRSSAHFLLGRSFPLLAQLYHVIGHQLTQLRCLYVDMRPPSDLGNRFSICLGFCNAIKLLFSFSPFSLKGKFYACGYIEALFGVINPDTSETISTKFIVLK